MGVEGLLVKLIFFASFSVLGNVVFPPMLDQAGFQLSEELSKTLAGVTISNTANTVDSVISGIDSGLTSPSLENEHLTRAVGKAIAAVIVLAAKPYKGENHDNLMKVANYAQNNWVEIAQQEITQERYPQLREANLDQFLTPDEYKLTQDGNLNEEDWRAIFIRLTIATCPKDRIVFNDTVKQKVANLLHTTFPKALRETLKEDFAKHGEAFAGLTLQLLTGMKAELGKLQQNQQEGFQSVLNHIEELENKLQVTNEQQQAVFTQISEGIHSGFAEVCRQQKVTETTITGLLDSLRNYLEAKFEELSQRVEKLESLLLQLLPNLKIAYILGQSKEKLDSIYKQLDKIMTYKKIHDFLHRLYFTYKKINPQNFYTIGMETIGSILNNQEDDLSEMVSIIDQIETECNYLSENYLSNRQLNWLNKLTEARANILASYQPEQSEKLSRSISRIKEVLEQAPTNINCNLNSTISELKLLKISNTIEEIRENYQGDQSQKLKDKVDYIKLLKQKLDELIKAHDYWQNIDDEINRFRNDVCYSSDVSISEISKKWEDLKKSFRNAEEHFKGNGLKPRLDRLIEKFKLVEDKLDQTEKHIDNIKESLNKFCDACHIYFNAVDHCLLDFCETKLKPVHRELENLLDNLNSRGTAEEFN